MWRPQPHLASNYVQEFDHGSSAISAGDSLTGATAAATVLGVELSSGTWGAGNAAGTLYVLLTAGDWVAGQSIIRSGVTVAKAAAATYEGRAQNSATHTAYHHTGARASSVFHSEGSWRGRDPWRGDP